MQFLRLLTAAAALSCGCGQSAPTPRAQRAPDYIAVQDLVEHYHGGQRAYDGRLVRVHLPAGTYRARPGYLEARLCGPHELIRFETAGTVGGDGDLTVEGTCRGIVRDGVVRCDNPRLNWYVRVEGCAVCAP